MENRLLDHIIEQRNGCYCHCVEVSNTYDLEGIAEAIIQEYSEDFTEGEIIEFLESLQVYYYPVDEAGDPREADDHEEQEVYNFSFREYIEWAL